MHMSEQLAGTSGRRKTKVFLAFLIRVTPCSHFENIVSFDENISMSKSNQDYKPQRKFRKTEIVTAYQFLVKGLTSERPNRPKMRFGRNRSFGQVDRSFGRSFGRIFPKKTGQNGEYFTKKLLRQIGPTLLQYVQ